MPSYVVTGGAQGIGKVIAIRLAQDAHVVVIDTVDRLSWDHTRIDLVTGSASDPIVTRSAAETAESRSPLAGWINNAAVVRDASLHDTSADEIINLINLNFSLALVGVHTAVNHFILKNRPGSIVNISSHQAQRPVRGALPYATAKAAIEGLTKAAAIDHGRHGIRVNAVALGSIDTDRYQEMRARDPERTDQEIAVIHPLGRVGTAEEVADVVSFLISPAAGFVTGTILPIDGGRAVHGIDPEAR